LLRLIRTLDRDVFIELESIQAKEQIKKLEERINKLEAKK